MYNPIRTIKSMYRRYNPVTGVGVIGATGAIVGGAAGVALPLYVGWELGVLVQKALEFGPIIGTATKAMGSIGLTALVGGITVPVGAVCGIGVGAGVGYVTGKIKESLENLVEKK